ncbi:MAG: hypothetical protein KAH72_07725 [Flavobacteriaceae bacterium]|nr:hypothetical protein [Flavobacteriaceae bacterium]
MSACRKCNNTNVVWNGVWKQCANCGEIHERLGAHVASLEKKHSIKDIAALPLKLTRFGKLVSRFRLIN